MSLPLLQGDQSINAKNLSINTFNTDGTLLNVVQFSSNNIFINGNLGIGTTIPLKKLYVEKNILISGTLRANNIIMQSQIPVIPTSLSNLIITNYGTSPALTVNQSKNATYPIAQFILTNPPSIISDSGYLQQSNKLVGTGYTVGGYGSYQGKSVSLSADGNTLAVGGWQDNAYKGATWIFTRSGTTWTQQGNKLFGTGYSGSSIYQGYSVSLSADGNTLAVGGYGNRYSGIIAVGATWIFTRSGTTWSQQGNRLVGTGYSGQSYQGRSVSLSADGNTVAVGGENDNLGRGGAVWIFIRSGTTWSQQGTKLVGTGYTSAPYQGTSVALSGDGNTLAIGGYNDNGTIGATWIFTRFETTWAQQGTKLVGSGYVGAPQQGYSISLSGDGNTLAIGGGNDNGTGATWIFTRSDSTWMQQGTKLIGTGNTGSVYQGGAVALSSDGNTLAVGGRNDNAHLGATWIFTRSGTNWTQKGDKLIGSGYSGLPEQGTSVSLSADGNTLAIGGQNDEIYEDSYGDFYIVGATWVFKGLNTPTTIYSSNIAFNIANNGNISIGTEKPLFPLHVVGQSIFSSNVGIGTTIPLQKLNVIGQSIFSTNIGIGTTLPLQSLHLVGQSYFSSNVGIGTNIPLQSLHVVGQSIFSSNIGIGTTLPLQQLSVIGQSIFSNNIGIGTTLPLQQLHLEGQHYFSSNVGIGTTTPLQQLHVVGKTILSSNVGIGTTIPLYSLHVIGNTIFSSNVGIGTTIPLQQLHIIGQSYFSSNVGIGTTLPLKPLHIEGQSYFSNNIGIGITTPLSQLHITSNTITDPLYPIFTTNANTLTPIDYSGNYSNVLRSYPVNMILSNAIVNYPIMYSPFSPGSNEASIYYSGSIGNFITLPSGSPADINLTNDYTIEAWINYVNYPNTSIPNFIGRMSPTSNIIDWSFGLTSNQKISFIYNSNTIVSQNTIQLNQWNHIALTYSEINNSITLFINGSSNANASRNGNIPIYTKDLPIIIGQYNNIPINAFNAGIQITQSNVYNANFNPYNYLPLTLNSNTTLSFHITSNESAGFNILNSGLVGIGKTQPNALLDILGNNQLAIGTIATPLVNIATVTGSVLWADATGSIGFGTTRPLQSMHVQCQSYITSNISIGTTIIPSASNSITVLGNITVQGFIDPPDGSTTYTSTAPYLSLNTSNSTKFLQWMQRTTTIGQSAWWSSSNLYLNTVSGAPSGNAYQGSVLIHDGRVVMIPYNSTTIGVFNPFNNTFTTPYIGGTWGSNAYAGGVFMPDGRVLCVPNDASNIGLYNPYANTFTTVLATTGYTGGVIVPDGRIIFVPMNTSNIGAYTPNTNIYSIPYSSGTWIQPAFSGGVLLSDGRVVFVPYNDTNIGIFDPVTNTYSTPVTEGTWGNYAFSGGVLIPDGRVVFVPYNATTIGIFNPFTNTYNSVSLSISGVSKFMGGVLLPDGRVAFIPYNATRISTFNPLTNVFATGGITLGSGSYSGGTLLPDGRVVLVPSNGNTVGLLNGTTIPPYELCYHPCFNKY